MGLIWFQRTAGPVVVFGKSAAGPGHFEVPRSMKGLEELLEELKERIQQAA